MRIYLDKNQCGLFGINYYGAGMKVVLSSSTILNSKEGGYDEYHQKILNPSREFVLQQTDMPGWFEVVHDNKIMS